MSICLVIVMGWAYWCQMSTYRSGQPLLRDLSWSLYTLKNTGHYFLFCPMENWVWSERFLYSERCAMLVSFRHFSSCRKSGLESTRPLSLPQSGAEHTRRYRFFYFWGIDYILFREERERSELQMRLLSNTNCISLIHGTYAFSSNILIFSHQPE
jgi:hypothetical protein